MHGRRTRRNLAALAGATLLAGAAAQTPSAADSTVTPALWPATAPAFTADAQLERRVATLLAGMTLEEKVGQVIQPDIGSVTPDDMRRYRFGAILNGGNSAPGNDEFAPPARWLELADAFY